MQIIKNPPPIFSNLDGTPLEDGYIHVGKVGLNPVTDSINVFWDAQLTQPAPQPIRTLGGMPSRQGTPALLFSSQPYSISVYDKNKALVIYFPDSSEFDSNTIYGSTAVGKGASLVGISDVGNYFASQNVEGALQELGLAGSVPRTIELGGTGASSVSGALTNLGVVNIHTESTINGSLSIPNSFPAAYLITDSGTPADYNIFFPPAPAGSLVFFRVSHAATKMYTLYDGGILMDGLDRRTLWAGETVMLLKTATGWTKIGGRSIPLHGVLRRTAAQTLTGGWQRVLLTEFGNSSKSLPLCFDSANSSFIAPRAGVYKFTSSFPVIGTSNGSESFGAFSLNLVGSASGATNAISIKIQQTGLTRITHNISNTIWLPRANYYGPVVYLGGITGTPSLAYSQGVLEISMSFEEVLTW